MNNKTILFVYNGPFCPTLGGIQRVTDTLAKNFIREGYRILYLVLGEKESATSYDYPAPLFFFPANDVNAPENIKFYHQFIEEQKVDIIINQSGSFPPSKLFLNTGNVAVKIISVLHCNPKMANKYLFEEYKYFLLGKGFANKLFFWFGVLPFFPFLKLRVWVKMRRHFRSLSKKSDYICLLSNEFEEELLSIYPVPKEKIIAISNPNSFSTPPFPEKKKKQLIYVGTLKIIQKRPDRLFKIWEKIYREFPEWELKIIGNGSFSSFLEKIVARKKLSRVTFEGHKPPEPYYREASIFCLTSNFEGWGMVLTEAMQYGTVPIAFDSYGAVREIIIPERNGILVRPFDLDEYANKLRILMKDDEKREKMSLAAFEDVKKFDEKMVVKQSINFFEKIER